MKWLVSFKAEVFDDRDPREWDWRGLIDMDDEVDRVLWDSLMIVPAEETT